MCVKFHVNRRVKKLNQFPGGPVVYQIGSTCVYPVASMSGQETSKMRASATSMSLLQPHSP